MFKKLILLCVGFITLSSVAMDKGRIRLDPDMNLKCMNPLIPYGRSSILQSPVAVNTANDTKVAAETVLLQKKATCCQTESDEQLNEEQSLFEFMQEVKKDLKKYDLGAMDPKIKKEIEDTLAVCCPGKKVEIVHAAYTGSPFSILNFLYKKIPTIFLYNSKTSFSSDINTFSIYHECGHFNEEYGSKKNIFRKKLMLALQKRKIEKKLMRNKTILTSATMVGSLLLPIIASNQKQMNPITTSFAFGVGICSAIDTLNFVSKSVLPLYNINDTLESERNADTFACKKLIEQKRILPIIHWCNFSMGQHALVVKILAKKRHGPSMIMIQISRSPYGRAQLVLDELKKAGYVSFKTAYS